MTLFNQLPKRKIKDIPEVTTAGPDDLTLIVDDAAKITRTIKVGNLVPPVPYASNSQAITGTATGVAMDPALTKAAIIALAPKPVYATASEAKLGARNDVVMSPARSFDASDGFNETRTTNATAAPADEVLIWDSTANETRRVKVDDLPSGAEGEFVRELYTVPPYDEYEYPPSTSYAGLVMDGDNAFRIAGSYDELTPVGGPNNEVSTYAIVNTDYAIFEVSGTLSGVDAPLMYIFGSADGFELSISDDDYTWSQNVRLAELTTADLDDPQHEDIIGMTPKLTKSLVNAPTPQITTATSLTLDASHNGALIVCTDAVTIMASPLPAGFECLVLATNGNVSIAGADLYEADNKTITINGRAASVMQVDGVGAWVTGCDDA